MNDLEAMRTFVLVADASSFSAAAAALGVGQPTVSRRIAELEEHLGVPLLQRSTRSVKLTESGARYLAEIRAALQAVDAARDAVAGPRPLDGRLRVSAGVAFASVWLCPRLPAFLAAHPALDVDLHLVDRHVDLVADGVDLALRVGGPDAATVTGRRLRMVERWFVASPEWVRREGEPCDVGDLRRHTGLLFAPTDHWPRDFGDPDRVAPRRVIAATSGQTLLGLALAGVGVALLPDWLVERDIGQARLVRLLPDTRVDALPLWVVWPTHRFQQAAARAFVDWVGGV